MDLQVLGPMWLWGYFLWGGAQVKWARLKFESHDAFQFLSYNQVIHSCHLTAKVFLPTTDNDSPPKKIV